MCRSQWPRRLRRSFAVARLLGLRVRIPPGAWMSVCCDCCVLSGRGLCVELIARPEESYRLWCVWVWSWILANEEALAHRCCCTTVKNMFNPLNPELNPICYLLALLGAHHFLHVSRIRVKLLTLRRLVSYIYGAPILDVSRSHTTTQHSR